MHRILCEGVLVFALTFWMAIAFVVMIVLGPEHFHIGIEIVGYFSDLTSLVFYGFPLALIWQVIRTRDSSPLYWPAITVNLLNCMLWYSYGVWAIDDPKVWVVNFVGAIFCIVELIVCANVPAIHTRLARRDSYLGIGLVDSNHEDSNRLEALKWAVPPSESGTPRSRRVSGDGGSMLFPSTRGSTRSSRRSTHDGDMYVDGSYFLAMEGNTRTMPLFMPPAITLSKVPKMPLSRQEEEGEAL
jgi:hypothetical protein